MNVIFLEKWSKLPFINGEISPLCFTAILRLRGMSFQNRFLLLLLLLLLYTVGAQGSPTRGPRPHAIFGGPQVNFDHEH